MYITITDPQNLKEGMYYLVPKGKLPCMCDECGTVDKLQTELNKLRWIPVGERLPKSIEGTEASEEIEILDAKRIHSGRYEKKLFTYWTGSYCNLDSVDNQENITHWRLIILPEQAQKGD